MPYTSATYSITKQGRSVTYYDDTGYTEVHVGGTRSWRNNNPGNLRYTNWTKNHGAIGKDGDGFAIFPDVETGNQAKGDLLRGKYGDHDSIREMLKGKYDEDGNYIPGTAYAPESDGNNPDAYADAIKKMSGIDVDNKKISELTPDEMNKLLDAMRRYEGWREGNAYCVSPDGEIQDPSYIIGNSMFGGLNPDDLRNLFGDASRTKSPLVFDLDGDGIETTSLSYGVFFDHDGNGFVESTGWIKPDDGFLVMDRNGNGIIDNGTELFGNHTILSNGKIAANGFQALAELDDNKDGKIDASDAAYYQLKIWRDMDGDGWVTYDEGENGQVITNELFTLSELGIQSIDTGYANTNITDANGNIIKQTGTFTWADGTTGNTGDVWFQTDNMYTVAKEWLDVPEEIAALPNMRGYGNVYDLHQAMVRDESGQLKNLVEQFAAETVRTINRDSMFNNYRMAA